MAELSPRLRGTAIADELTEDRWLGGRLTLVQPRRGHRVGTDAALLVAAAGTPEGRIVDVGAGVGAVGLALAKRSALASADLVEIDPELARLAESNAARNGLQARTRVLRLDALDPREPPRGRASRRGGRVRRHQPAVLRGQDGSRLSGRRQSASACPAARRRRRGARRLDSGLARDSRARRAVRDDPPARRAWRDPRRDRRAARRAGALPVHPTSGASAHRLLISGVKGSKAPLRIAPALILYGADGKLTAEADALHRGERLIGWGV